MDENEELFSACRSGNENSVRNFLQKGISPNVQDTEGNTPLQYAASNGFSEIVFLLLKNGALVDLSNKYGWTPLMHSSLHGHTRTTALLLRMNAKVNVCNKLGLSPMDIAAWNGDVSLMNLLIEAGAVIDCLSSNQSRDYDLSPLLVAAFQGHDAIIDILLEKGASVNQVSPVTGLTPLIVASCNGHEQVVEKIVEFGGDVNKLDLCGRSALDMAIVCGNHEIQLYLDNITATKFCNADYVESEDILQAVRSADLLKIKSILQQNPSYVNMCDSIDGTTPLMIAAMLGRDNIIDDLIYNGAVLDAQDRTNGWTALMYAVFHRHASSVRVLLENGANADVCASSGYTALDLARLIGSSETDIVEILVANSTVDVFQTQYSSPKNKTMDGNLSATERAGMKV